MAIAGCLHQATSTARYLACSGVHCYVKKMIIVGVPTEEETDCFSYWANGLAGNGIIFCGHNFIASVFWSKKAART